MFRSGDVATFIELPVVQQPSIPGGRGAGSAVASPARRVRGPPVALPEKCMPQSGQFGSRGAP